MSEVYFFQVEILVLFGLLLLFEQLSAMLSSIDMTLLEAILYIHMYNIYIHKQVLDEIT